MNSVLLLSGGVDSAALAVWKRPSQALFIDYGQVTAVSERRASERIARSLGLPWASLEANCGGVGSGLLSGSVSATTAPTAEWWPFRNQLLGTLGAAWAINHGFADVWFGVVADDGDRHRDGSAWFVDALNALTKGQEGGVEVHSPAVHMTSFQLIDASGIDRALLGCTFSCHSTPVGCGTCPGCRKRSALLAPFRVDA